MKWTENGITFDGTVPEYKELHADSLQQKLKRTRIGRRVSVYVNEDEAYNFTSVKEAADWISHQTGRYVSSSTLTKLLNPGDSVNLERFKTGASLFENNTNDEGENNHVE